MSRKEGTIIRWDEGKGFGFIRADASAAQDIFLHVRDYRGAVAPRQGLRVSFDDVHVGGKGPRAVAVQAASGASAASSRQDVARRPAGRPAASVKRGAVQAQSSGGRVALLLMAGYACALAWLVWQRHVPWWVLPGSLLLNLATFLVYWQDKHAAQKRRWRVPESTLHLWSLAGGWGGAWCAQQVLRHKSVKSSFRSAYWATVVVHCAALAAAWWILGPGRSG